MSIIIIICIIIIIIIIIIGTASWRRAHPDERLSFAGICLGGALFRGPLMISLDVLIWDYLTRLNKDI